MKYKLNVQYKQCNKMQTFTYVALYGVLDLPCLNLVVRGYLLV